MFGRNAVAISLACLTPTILAQASQYTVKWYSDYHCGYTGTDYRLPPENIYNQTFTGTSGCAWFQGYENQGAGDNNYHQISPSNQYLGSVELLFVGPDGGELHPAIFSDSYCKDGLQNPEAAFTLNQGANGVIDTPGCYTLPGKPNTQGYIISQDGS